MTRRQRRSSIILIVSVLTYLATQVGLNAAVRAGIEPADDPVFAEKFSVLNDRPEFFTPVADSRVLILGSSRTQHGIDAGRLARALGPDTRAFNFGTPAGGPLTNSLYLRRLLAAGVRAELLLVEIHPGYLGDETPPFETRWLRPNRLRVGEAAALNELGCDIDSPPHLGSRGWIAASSVYRTGLAGRHAPLFSEACALPLNRPHDRDGFSSGPEFNAKYRSKGTEATRRQYADIFENYRVGGPGCAALRRIVGGSHAAGMQVRIFVTPEDEPLRSWYGDAGNAMISAFIADLAAETDGPAIDGRAWLDANDTVDGHHCTPEGAAKFTDRLAAALALRGSP